MSFARGQASILRDHLATTSTKSHNHNVETTHQHILLSLSMLRHHECGRRRNLSTWGTLSPTSRRSTESRKGRTREPELSILLRRTILALSVLLLRRFMMRWLRQSAVVFFSLQSTILLFVLVWYFPWFVKPLTLPCLNTELAWLGHLSKMPVQCVNEIQQQIHCWRWFSLTKAMLLLSVIESLIDCGIRRQVENSSQLYSYSLKQA